MRTLTLLCLTTLLSFSLCAQNLEQRKISDFKSVKFEGRGDLILTEGNTAALELEAGDGVDLSRVRTYVQGNTLYIKYDRDDEVWDMHPKIIVYLSYRSLHEISAAGIIDVRTESPIRNSSFSFIAEGMGKSNLEVAVDRITVQIAGTADVKLRGIVNRGSLILEGTGELDAFDMKAASIDAEVNGTGSLFVYATERLHVEANGFGAQVKYKGNPADKVIDKSGWVSVKQVNSR
ncbi:hypothetical protein OKW21_004733 [Catalinimonas alkaloidigena]|uniref:head GIN domain-containing protein n=1 Tax=Catalinimonas alkaloidigena TaxID=1075417 RepID=UPI0024070555|nr:head GIN domain-containing protein [Catalinimonas alkaloidigena]MDF9799470.1 hypothetical protein [Catalinimonas alkaloidigena]